MHNFRSTHSSERSHCRRTRLPDLAHLVQRSAKWAARLASAVRPDLTARRTRVDFRRLDAAQPLRLTAVDLNACTDSTPCPTHAPGSAARPGRRRWFMHGGWTSAHALELHGRRSPTPVPISNARTQLSRPGRPPARCRAFGLTTADLQRPYRSPTPVPNSTPVIAPPSRINHRPGHQTVTRPWTLANRRSRTATTHRADVWSYGKGWSHSRWSCTARRSTSTPVPISNART